MNVMQRHQNKVRNGVAVAGIVLGERDSTRIRSDAVGSASRGREGERRA